MTDLKKESCVSCHRGAPKATAAEIAEMKRQIPRWEIVQRQGVKRLTRGFEFPDFAKALTFTNKVGALAEKENHHPEIVTEWGGVTVSWWTHKIRGLHRNDFIMAAKTDRLAP